MCNCRKALEEKLLERFKEQAPEAQGHYVRLLGYTMILGTEVIELGYMPIETTASFPLKKGGEKVKVAKTNMIFTFCPFCGVKYRGE